MSDRPRRSVLSRFLRSLLNREGRTPATLGQQGEQLAADYLTSRGYRIVARGSRDRLGELDLVAVEGATIVFVEVKTRRSTDAGHPAEAVDGRKQRKIAALAIAFLKRRGLLGRPARFDVIAITWPEGGAEPRIDHYRGAFESAGPGSMYS